MSPFSRPRFRMLSVRGPSNIPGNRVSTSNCIDLQESFRRVDFDAAGFHIDPQADGASEGYQDLRIFFSLNEKQVRPTGSAYIYHPPQWQIPSPHYFQS